MRLSALCNLTDEAIAATMCGFNEARSGWIITQSLADLANGDFKNGFADKGPWPDGVEKFLFRGELARMRQQVFEHCERFWPELDSL
jgi:hypothetical protein